MGTLVWIDKRTHVSRCLDELKVILFDDGNEIKSRLMMKEPKFHIKK